MAHLTPAQSRALSALASTRKAGGYEQAGAINHRGSTMTSLVSKGFAARVHRFCDVYEYKITEAGREALSK